MLPDAVLSAADTETGVLDVKMTANMHEQLRKGKPILAPGAHDTMSAKIISAYGFDAV